MSILILAIVTFAIAAWLSNRFCDPSSRLYILDHPNARSLHTNPTPRSGGMAILVAMLLTWSASLVIVGSTGRFAAIVLPGLLVAGISFLDDHYSISAVYRIVVHFFAAAVLVYLGYRLPLEIWPGVVLTWPAAVAATVSVVYVVWMINLYNFMDGMDGFAGGMAVFGFGVFAVMGWLAGRETFFFINLIIATASAGFLVFNFPSARIFMGDIGSSTLGMLAATLSLWGARDGIFPFWIAVLVFSPFIVDATVTLVRRLVRGERFWQAHKSHYYQKLVQAGWGHRKTVLLEYAIMLSCGATALWGVNVSDESQLAILAGWALFYSVFFFWVSRLAARSL